jgi:transposase
MAKKLKIDRKQRSEQRRMLGKKRYEAKMMYSVTLEDLVPGDNFYRVIDGLLDLRFLYKECKEVYGETGKPSIDPVVFFKILLFGYFENILSDRELVRRASDSLGVRLYLGYDLDEDLPWHSTISRTRQLYKEEIFEKLFDNVLEKCSEAGLVSGEHQSIDSTLVRANASLSSLEKRIDIIELKEYIKKTNKENVIQEKAKSDKKDANGSSNMRNKRQTKNEEYISKTDPDSRMASKGNKPSNMYYSTHYGVDSRKKVITDVLTTHADIKDSTSLPEVIKRVEKRLSIVNKKVKSISADKGYYSVKNLRMFEEKEITAYIPRQRFVNSTGNIDKQDFIYNYGSDTYKCPGNKLLKYFYTKKEKESRVYTSNPKGCNNCMLKIKCTSTSKRMIHRSIYQEEVERAEQRMKRSEGKEAMRLRKTGPEPLFGEAKANHGLSKYMNRGISNAQKTSFVIATVQNLKRLLNARNKRKDICKNNLQNILLTNNYLQNKYCFCS